MEHRDPVVPAPVEEPVERDPRLPPGQKLTSQNHSYAMLSITDAQADAGRRMEWKETLNTNAVVLSDRNTGMNADMNVSSVWTDTNSGDWRGGIVRNDNSTAFDISCEVTQTMYGNLRANHVDNLFVSESDRGGDAWNIHTLNQQRLN